MSKLIALIDCNNFFVSCERTFRPDLHNKPVAVLSNNDGCIVARSQEVKALGIPMGAPAFKYKQEFKKHAITLFSSNFSLYGDMSNRVMSILETFSPTTEIYSIDEAFLELQNVAEAQHNPTQYGAKIAQTVKTHVGIPVSVGIAPTKTLAKIAGRIAKTKQIKESVFDLTQLTEKEQYAIFQNLEIGEVWGIGWNRAEQLNKMGVYTIADFMNLDRSIIRKTCSVLGERIHLELHGTPCFDIDSNPTPKKGIASTRSFGKPVTALEELKESVSTHIANATRKLRKQKSVAGQVTVFIRTSKHTQPDQYFSTAANIQIPTPTDDPMILIKEGLRGLERVFVPGQIYKKVGVYLTDISPRDSFKLHMFSEPTFQNNNRTQLLDSIDTLNNQYGKDMIRYAIQGIDQKWKVKAEKVSPRYTTNWDEILQVHI